MHSFLELINSYAWGLPMLLLLGLTGLFLTLGLKAYPLRNLFPAFALLWRSRKSQGQGDISGFNALMTALSSTVGTGNIAGVATAIAAGGPGALFWMWMIALLGMATKFSEAVLAVHFREKNDHGNYVGGPMYYIKNGFKGKLRYLAWVFAFFGMLAGFGIGNGVQVNSIADALASEFAIPMWMTGVATALLVGMVLLGGIQRIADVAGKLVPIMTLAYIFAGLIALAIFYERIPQAFSQIIYHAFNPTAAAGGFAGAAVWAAIRFGIARGIFSNEAGLGSSPIAHAAARTSSPVQQGTIAMLGTFIDTLIICSITGLVIVASGAWQFCDSNVVSHCQGITGAPLTAAAFASAIPGAGSLIVSLGLSVFAFTTIIGWSFYSEKCTEFLFGSKAVPFFRLLWVLAIPAGALFPLETAWLIADTLNALMALPNLLALILLSPIVFTLTRRYLDGSQPVSK